MRAGNVSTESGKSVYQQSAVFALPAPIPPSTDQEARGRNRLCVALIITCRRTRMTATWRSSSWKGKPQRRRAASSSRLFTVRPITMPYNQDTSHPEVLAQIQGCFPHGTLRVVTVMPPFSPRFLCIRSKGVGGNGVQLHTIKISSLGLPRCLTVCYKDIMKLVT